MTWYYWCIYLNIWWLGYFIVIGSVTGDGNGNSIVQKESCVIIKAKKGDEVKVVDEFLFRIYGVK